MKDILFSNAVAVSRMDKLLSLERLNRIIESANLESAVKVLLEISYGGGISLDSYSDFEKLLQAESKLMDKFAKENIPNKTGIECFFLFADYHNIKVLMRGLLEKKDFDYLLDDSGIYPISHLKEEILQDKPSINIYVDNIIAEAKDSFEAVSAREVDVKFDLAMLKDIKDRISKFFVSKYIKKYFNNFIDYMNVINLIRVLKVNETLAYYLSLYIEGGKYDLELLKNAFDDVANLKDIIEETIFIDYKDTILETPLEDLELLKDSALMKDILRDKNDLLTEAPSLAFYLEKKNEISLLRYILICLKNNIDKDQMRNRLRRLYD